MIDGIKLACTSVLASNWLNSPLLDFGVLVSESTGEILSKTKEATYNAMRFKIGNQANGNGFCSLMGSLHRYHNEGGTNADTFTFSNLQSVINNLQELHSIDPSETIIQRLEVGVNIPLPYSPDIVVKSAICHKGKPFLSYKSQNESVGKFIEYQNYTYKIYNKSRQSNTQGNVLRIEVATYRNKMLEPYGIKSLSDLKDPQKCFLLVKMLLEKISETIFYDFKFKGVELSTNKRLKFQQYSNPNFWANLDRYNLAKNKKRFHEKAAKYNTINWQKFLSEKVAKIWLDLFDLKAQKMSTFYAFKCMLENVDKYPVFGHVKKEKKFTLFLKEKEPQKKCFCVSCGRDISDQKNTSRFCSEKLHGKEAKKCRNKESNQRLNLKRKLNRAASNDLTIKVKFRNREHPQELRAKSINVVRSWLDMVESIETIKPPPKKKINKNNNSIKSKKMNEKTRSKAKTVKAANVVSRAKIVYAETMKHYEKERQSKCLKSVWKTNIKNRYFIGYRTFLNYIHLAEKHGCKQVLTKKSE